LYGNLGACCFLVVVNLLCSINQALEHILL